MSKPYFAKYLPTEEAKEKDIKHGDRVYSPDKLYGQSVGEKGGIITFDSRIIYDLSYTDGIPKWYRIGLFLCSRDIKVGDKVTWFPFDPEYGPRVISNQQDIELVLNSEKEMTTHGYKVIGLISPEATWVTEGMEFDVDDLMKMVEYQPDPHDFWAIKCPHCGSYK